MSANTNLTTLSRAITALWDNYYTPNWEKFPKEYSMWNTMIGKDQVTGYYNTLGNLKEAVALSDGADFPVEAITQAYETTIVAAPFAAGLGITWSLIKEAQNLSSIVDDMKAYAQVAALVTKLEKVGIAPWDNAFTTNLSTTGVPLCSASNPCFDLIGTTGLTWSSLQTGPAFGTGGYANVIAALEQFSQMKDHQGSPVPSIPRVFKTHAQNQYKYKALVESQTVPLATANTSEINAIPNLTPIFSNYITSKTAWFIEDDRPDRPHGICQYLNSVPTPETKTEVRQGSRNINITSGYFMGAGALSNVGIVGSTGL